MKLFNQILFMMIIVVITSGCSSFRPKAVGLKDGRLQPCPPAPKCVSSYYAKGIHHVKPLRYRDSRAEAYQRLINIIKSMKKSEIVTADPDYIHVQFEVTRIKWIDNTEFLFDDEEKIIHVSSTPAAKIGFWDWGENRRRVKLIKSRFEADIKD